MTEKEKVIVEQENTKVELRKLSRALSNAHSIATAKLLKESRAFAKEERFDKIPHLKSEYDVMAEILYKAGYRQATEDDEEIALSVQSVFEDGWHFGSIETLNKFVYQLVGKNVDQIGGFNYRTILEEKRVFLRENFGIDYDAEMEEKIERLEDALKDKVKETAEKFERLASEALLIVNFIDLDEWNWYQDKLGEICKEITEGKV